jgi:uncharacterized protein with HEPN domain
LKQRSGSLCLQDILQAMNRVEEYVRGFSYDDFLDDGKTVDAVIRNLLVVGEAAGKVPKAVRTRHPEIPWSNMTGMRNILVHDYFGIDLTIVWRIVTKNLPATKPLIASLLDSENGKP